MSSDDVRKTIEDTIKAHRVVLFMKGARFAPACGFSASVVGILDGFLPSYHTVDVLEDPAIRDGVKAFSDWPTIPQLYVDGQFVGGADIVKEMHARDELQALLGAEAVGPKQPTMTVSDDALKELRAAAKSMGADGAMVVSRRLANWWDRSVHRSKNSSSRCRVSKNWSPSQFRQSPA